MARFFTYSWKYAEALKETEVEGELLGHAHGSRFSRRGIKRGHFVYIVALNRGQLYLLGKMQVDRIVPQDEAHRLLGKPPGDDPEHLIASTCTPTRLLDVPMAIVKELRYISGSKKKELARKEDVLKPQAVRAILELDAESASRLDELLGEMVPFAPGQ